MWMIVLPINEGVCAYYYRTVMCNVGSQFNSDFLEYPFPMFDGIAFMDNGMTL